MTSATALRNRAVSGSLATRSFGIVEIGNFPSSAVMSGYTRGHSRVNSPTTMISLGARAATMVCIPRPSAVHILVMASLAAAFPSSAKLNNGAIEATGRPVCSA